MTLNATQFLYPKVTGTHADSLAVAGLGYLVSRIGGEREAVIQDHGAYWSVTASSPVTDAVIDAWDGDPFFPYVRLKNDRSTPVEGEIDLQAEYARRDEKKAADKARRESQKAHGRKPNPGTAPVLLDSEAAAQAAAAVAAHPETDLLARFNQIRSGFQGDVELHRALRSSPPREAVRQQLTCLTDLSSQRPLPEDEALDLSTSQWFMPIGGKGISGLKPSGASANALPAHLANGFDAWLRCIGMYRAMTVHTLDKDVRLAVLAPAFVDANLLGVLRNTVRDSRGMWGRLSDVRAPLALARALVENSEEYRGGPASTGLRLRFARRRPRDILRGLDISIYKKMGTASALMNVAFLGTPSWAAISTRADANEFLETLDDLERVTAGLDDEKDVELLRALARFVSAGTLDTALSFFVLDAATQMTRQARTRKPWRVSTNNLRRILMGIDDGTLLRTIIDDPGFLNIAKAIRAATIQAQTKEDSPLNPRYGLAQAWRQKAGLKDRFVQELAGFVTTFNAEIAREREVRQKRGDGRPVLVAMVTSDDLASVIRLIEAPGSSSALVANLLLAFGFSVNKKHAPDPAGPPTSPT